MFDNKSLTLACVLLAFAPQDLGATDAGQASCWRLTEAPLGYNREDELVWRPSAGGLGKFSVVLPEAGIVEALRYSDVSSLYYLSNITEENLTTRPGPIVDFRLEPDHGSVTLDWAMTPFAYAGLSAVKNKATSLKWSVRSRMIFGSTPHSLNTAILSLGEESTFELQGARLRIDEAAESLYFASTSGEDLSKFSLSYGQRHWDALNGMDFAWTAGVLDNTPFVSLQLEKEVVSARAFIRLSAHSDDNPMLHLGLELSLHNGKWGSWRSTAMSGGRGKTSLDSQSLTTHRRHRLSRLWRRDVTVNTLESWYKTNASEPQYHWSCRGLVPVSFEQL